MKKLIVIAIVLITFCLSGTAQNETRVKKDFRFGFGATAGIPVGDIKPYSNFVLSGNLQAEQAQSQTFGITLSAGYLNFSGKNGTGSTGFIPILLGGKYHFTDKLYGHAQLGISLSTEKNGGGAFTYAPSIGYDVSEKFDIALKYQAATKDNVNISFIGLRAAYNF